MLTEANFTPDQVRVADWIEARTHSAVWADVGFGKTPITLRVLHNWMRDGKTRNALIVAPPAVIKSTWPAALEQWTFGRRITASTITAKNRIPTGRPVANITLVSNGIIAAVVHDRLKDWPWDTVVIDESSALKHWGSVRTTAFRNLRTAGAYDRMIQLDATPGANSAEDLFPTTFLLDGGSLLGCTQTAFRRTYCESHPFVKNVWSLRDGSEGKIRQKAGTLAVRGEVDRPPIRVAAPKLVFSNDDRQVMAKALRDAAAADVSLTFHNVLSRICKAHQAAGCGVIAHTQHGKTIIPSQTAKLRATAELITWLNRPCFVLYQYRHEAAMLKERLPGSVVFDGKAATVDLWNEGNIPVMLAHPASAGYGLNLQYGGHVLIWFSLPWSLNEYIQTRGRLDRMGQTETVLEYILISPETPDEDILMALTDKDSDFMDGLNHAE